MWAIFLRILLFLYVSKQTFCTLRVHMPQNMTGVICEIRSILFLREHEYMNIIYISALACLYESKKYD